MQREQHGSKNGSGGEQERQGEALSGVSSAPTAVGMWGGGVGGMRRDGVLEVMRWVGSGMEG